MLNIHICTHCDTFLCKKTTCVSHVNGKNDRGYEREIKTDVTVDVASCWTLAALILILEKSEPRI